MSTVNSGLANVVFNSGTSNGIGSGDVQPGVGNAPKSDVPGAQNAASPSGSLAASKNLTPSQAAQATQKLNQLLAGGSTKVEADPSAPANDIWLNLVDKTTGQVIERFPPEGIRQFLKTGHTTGLSRNLQG